VLDAKPKAGELARVLRGGGNLILAATQGAPYGRGPSAWRLARGLNSHGFETLTTERAGSGSFTVARLSAA
jgi:hypothetical protein